VAGYLGVGNGQVQPCSDVQLRGLNAKSVLILVRIGNCGHNRASGPHLKSPLSSEQQNFLSSIK
jgi:hypothetical protein